MAGALAVAYHLKMFLKCSFWDHFRLVCLGKVGHNSFICNECEDPIVSSLMRNFIT